MRKTLVILPLFIVCLIYWSPVKGYNSVLDDEYLLRDTTLSQVFESERELSLFIVEELELKESVDELDRQEIDSLHQVLSNQKSIQIAKKDLLKFLGYRIPAPVAKMVISQSLNLAPKEKTQKLSLEVNKGDQFELSYEVEEGIGSAAYLEVHLNQVKVAQSLSSKRGKKIALDFTIPEEGMLELIFRNVGPFKEKGNLEVRIVPRKEQVQLKKIRSTVSNFEIQDSWVNDTIFQTLVDEQVLLNHRNNLKGNSIVQKQLNLGLLSEVIGFGILYYPADQKDKLQVFRREIFRENPLEDFSVKELIGKSFTYLPEFSISDLSCSLMDNNRTIFWSNMSSMGQGNWNISSNSKQNYAFFRPGDLINSSQIQVKFSNTSNLYDIEIGIEVIVLSIKKFKIKQEVEIQEFEETILLKLL
jgi:hypothetical protein|uniref:hypothetical protein n=1 Tax=Algoriphagus sp. TaxID=1872435 RepID=UPI004047B418